MKLNLKDISIKWQLMIICVLLVIVPVLILGTISYNQVKDETYVQIEERLTQQSLELNLFVSSVYNEVESSRLAVDKQAKAVVSEQAGAVYEMIYAMDDDEKIKETISKISVGETGYIWVVDYEGNYIVSKGRSRDGDNIWGAKDNNGILFIQEAIAKAQKLEGNGRDFQIYPWQNEGEPEPRDKIAALLHIPEKQWVIGVSTYFDELVDTGFEEEKINTLKDEIASIVVGKTGYVYILNSAGDYVLSLQRARDGENIIGAKDANGIEFIKEIVDKSVKLEKGQTVVQYYPWQNEDDKKARMKLVGLSYFPEWDWIVGSSAYQEDFLDGLKSIKRSIYIVSIFSIIIGSLVAYFFALMLIKPIKKVEKVVGSNDLSQRCALKEKNEIGRIGESIDGMLDNLAVPIREVADKTEKIANGDLTVSLDIKAEGDVGRLVSGFKKMIDKLKGFVGNVNKNSEVAASAAEELSASAEQVNASMEQVSATIQELAKGAQVVTKSSSDVQQRADTTASSAKNGSESANQVSSKMKEIQTTTIAGAEKIKSLGAKSQQIGNIVETINNISEQTNLLALNAAIEAARAGEAGRGFAVVADEVRKLAEESSKATSQISDLIAGIRDEIENAVKTMDSNTTQVEEGSQSVQQALVAFEEIPVLVGAMSKALDEMAAIAEENAAGNEELTSSTQEVSNAMGQVSNSAQSLAKGAEELRNMAKEFKI